MMAGGAVKGDLTRMKFSIVNAAKDVRYYTHLAESLPVASFIGAAVQQSYSQAVALGLGDRLLPPVGPGAEEATNPPARGVGQSFAPPSRTGSRWRSWTGRRSAWTASSASCAGPRSPCHASRST